jgi:predicted P-loop ATPase
MLTSMVARILDPGCRVPYIPVVCGPQGCGKSRMLLALAVDPALFTDYFPEGLTSRDSVLHLQDKWLVEMCDGDALSKDASKTTKDFITRQEDVYRPPYQGDTVRHPRQFVFVGSTNDYGSMGGDAYDRRVLPFEVTRCDIDRIVADREQLFAEATRRYLRGEEWLPTPELIERHSCR